MPREPIYMKVDIGGDVVRREAEVEVLLYDRAGKAAVTHMRPRLRPGEILVERLGMIPEIVTDPAFAKSYASV